MADIKQAAKWMQEGKQVKRAAWRNSPVLLHVCERYGKVHDELNRKADFTAFELLADDWEIAE
jgi:hypothetical protein